MKKISSLLLASLLLTALLTSCTDEESDLGLNLTDSTTLYHGIADTLFANAAWTDVDDSLPTSNYSYGIIGTYHDPLFGDVTSTLYTQIALPANSTSISFDSLMTIDSVVLTFTKLQLYPDTAATYRFHFEVMQLAEPLASDSVTFYATDSLPVNPATRFFDADITVGPADTLVSLLLDSSINSVLRQSASADDFITKTKGLRIRITNAADRGLMGIDFSASTTCLRTHYHYISGTDTTYGSYAFLMGAGTAHFTRFSHNYSGTIFASGNPVDGSARLYLEPLAGHRARLSFDNAVKAFHEAHPLATIHHAELILPVAGESPALRPDQIILLNTNASGKDEYTDDYIYNNRGYDGTIHEDSIPYCRIRVTQHLQGLLRQGTDHGMSLILNSRRHSAAHVILQGNATGNRPRINIVYSE